MENIKPVREKNIIVLSKPAIIKGDMCKKHKWQKVEIRKSYDYFCFDQIFHQKIGTFKCRQILSVT